MANRIVLLVHYFPPLNSAGGKRMEAMAKYFARAGRSVTVITTRKTPADGPLTESLPAGVTVISLGLGGQASPDAVPAGANASSAGSVGRMRGLKAKIMHWFGQLPDPRLPFAFAMLSPFLDGKARAALSGADVVVASTPPWPGLLAARFVQWRFGSRTILDYRDHFSECHEMPGTALAKCVETLVDRWLCRGADGLVVVSEPMARYYRRWHPRVEVVLNGFDPEVLAEVRATARWRREGPASPVALRYLGLVTPDRVPRNMIAGFAAAVTAGAVPAGDVRFEYYGDCGLVEKYLKDHHPALAHYFHFLPSVPYRRALKLIVESVYLLFAENSSRQTLSAQGVLTTKLFEYLAAGRPIVADIAPETLAGQLLKRAEAGHLVSTEAAAFEAFFRSPQFRSPAATFDPPFVQSLSRAAQAKDYLGILDRYCSTPGSQSNE